jgi:PAS domain S-box-containing protein
MRSMVIATILLVGIGDASIARQLEEHGYGIVFAPDVDAVAARDEPYGLVIVSQSRIGPSVGAVLERLRFLCDSAPLAVMVECPSELSEELLASLKRGAVHYLLSDEASTGLLCTRVDGIFLFSGLDRGLLDSQATQHEKRSLQQELLLRKLALEHEQAINADILASLTCGVVILDLNGTVLSINDAAIHLLNPRSDSLLGSRYDRLFPEPLRRPAAKCTESAAGGTMPPPSKVKMDRRYIELSGYQMKTVGGESRGTILLLNDITEQEETTIALQQAERLTTVGTMLSGVAHELRNPLSIISARAQRGLAKKEVDAGWVEKNLSSIIKQTERCATLVNNLLNFTRQSAAVAGHYPVGEVLNESLTYASYDRALDTIDIVKEYTSGLKVYGDRARYTQVFLNIILNAADAMAGSGTLTVRTTGESDEMVCVEINDSGPGIDPAISGRIFDPFFTTKDTGKGTGLGLAISHKIVIESGGSLRFESRPGSTSFFIRLPTRNVALHA